MLMRALLLGLLLPLVACSAHRRDQLLPVRPELASARSVAVTESTCWAAQYVEEEVIRRLKGCGPDLKPASPSEADLLIVWSDTPCAFCLDVWDPRCDPSTVKVTITSTAGSEARWAAHRPGWCLEPDCLLVLFLRDLRSQRCPESLAVGEG